MFEMLYRRVIWACGIAAIAGSLNGADGVVHIDQYSAVAGNVTPGDAPGFPVTISQPGSYRLSGNITVPDGDTTAIQITSDAVTLDLNGFSILGPVVCTTPTSCPPPGKGIGVQAVGDQTSGPRGVRVRNGSVRGMGQFGIFLTGDGSFVEKVAVGGNAAGGMSVAGSVIESTAVQNGSFGIIAMTVRDSTSMQNAGDGIILNGSGGVATGNISSLNGGVGIAGFWSSATNNAMFLNKGVGILATCPSAIMGNTIVAIESGAIETRGDGCVQVNNATRP